MQVQSPLAPGGIQEVQEAALGPRSASSMPPFSADHQEDKDERWDPHLGEAQVQAEGEGNQPEPSPHSFPMMLSKELDIPTRLVESSLVSPCTGSGGWHCHVSLTHPPQERGQGVTCP